KSGNVTGCFTTGGTLIGDKYVGGIIGYNEVSGEGGMVDGIDGSVNKANVIGNKYVGGIVGANADMGSGGKPSSTYSKHIEVKNWKNRGMVTAREAYGGGITGYNAGRIENCDCSVDVSAIKGEVLLGYLKKYTGSEETPAGNYIGGMAGYNNGYIYADSNHRTKKVVSVVAGNRYVGGMVGYNDCDGDVEGYDLSGGYISGNSFVGGFAGVNVSEKMFVANSGSDDNGETLHTVSKPNCIEGNYFVGGMVGGNLLLLEKDLTIGSNTDNFLGQIKSRDKGKGWFVGGVLGYNVNIQKAADSTSQSDSIKDLADGMACAAEEAVEDAGVLKEQVDVGDAVEKVVNRASLTMAVNELTVNGDVDNNSDSTGGTYELNQIEGHVYVGGVVGYNQKDSRMTIKNIVNKIPVIANGYIEKVDKNNDKYSHAEGNRYSYAGGIIGMAPQYTVIDHCHNDGAGRVKTPDETTYHGALVEVNEGTIQCCTTTTVGEYAWNYVGGLAGVNGYSIVNKIQKPGTITKCEVGSTVFGMNCIGGVAAENYGEISDITFTDKATVSGNGKDVGGIAGVNKAVKNGNDIVVQGKIRDVNMKNLKVTGNGTYVGGIAGTNEGVIVGGTKKDNSQSITPDGSSSVRGDSCVGGIIGRANGDVRSTAEDFESGSVVVIAQGFTNEGSVVAVNGDAGGIVGNTDLNNYKIDNCRNNGSVEAQQAGNAGGIISTNMKQEKENGPQVAVFADGTGEGGGANTSSPASRTITGCTNTGEVKSGRGDVGGIAAHNDGTIERCKVEGDKNKFLTVSARKNVGGVTSLNKGIIETTTLQYITVTNSNLSGSKMSIGGAVGINEGTLSGVSFTDGTVQSYSKNSNVGGLAGRNEKTGTIQGTSDKNKVSNVKVCFAVDGINGNMGGIAGYNGGSITGYHYVNTQGHPGIVGKGGSAFGYGGISGINAGTVSGCRFQGVIT
ncbi:MAG: hypothetical protein Q4D55_07985, partial [Eubacteriales bacterium]|nr:hypothetical protein [Eubacteriales bacterium]